MSIEISFNSAPTRAGVSGVLVRAATERKAIAVAVPAASVVWPATTATAAEPSGQRDSTEHASDGSSAEASVDPFGTAPGSGKTVARYGATPACAAVNVSVDKDEPLDRGDGTIGGRESAAATAALAQQAPASSVALVPRKCLLFI
jgi:hypothetical protein